MKAEEETVPIKGTAKATAPKCSDRHCPTHGSLKTRGKVFEGKVISTKMQRAVTVEWARLVPIPKYERYEKRRSRAKARKPDCITVKEGDRVRIAECRPLSKTISFVVTEVLK